MLQNCASNSATKEAPEEQESISFLIVKQKRYIDNVITKTTEINNQKISIKKLLTWHSRLKRKPNTHRYYKLDVQKLLQFEVLFGYQRSLNHILSILTFKG